MKKLLLTIAIILGTGLISFADPNGGGVFQRGNEPTRLGRENTPPALPTHGKETNQPAPLGTGVMVLTALGAAYLVGKKRREE
ncbi:MAG: hypothetical protein II661_10575 [Bacteroidales bacterium]|nr:hypothetical protein [Bacteroidales bacterium]